MRADIDLATSPEVLAGPLRSSRCGIATLDAASRFRFFADVAPPPRRSRCSACRSPPACPCVIEHTTRHVIVVDVGSASDVRC